MCDILFHANIHLLSCRRFQNSSVWANYQHLLTAIVRYVGCVEYLCTVKRHFNTHIEGLDLKFWRDLMESRGELVTLWKGDCLCRLGEPTNVCGYVKSGYLIYGMTGTKYSNIGGFAFADALCGDYPNCLYNAPASFDLIAGRKTEVYVIDATILPALFKEDSYICDQGRLFMESAYRSLLRRYCMFCRCTPAECYLELIREHPQIEQDVPQAEIARYLRISPTHLCRIRKENLSL